MDIVFGHNSHDFNRRPSVMTLGNFDGMHVGHQTLVKTVRSLSLQEKLIGGLMTFDPHPLKILAPEKHTKLIFDMSEKIKCVESLGLDFFVIEPFSRELSELTPEDFFKTMIQSFDIQFLIVGHDFNFGKNRSGTLDVLKKLCESHNVNLQILPPVRINGEVVSSTHIREAISSGDFEKANLFLGREFFMGGLIERGAARGRTLGFPTANLFTKAELIPKNGVHFTLFTYKGKNYPSVTNIGQNPTFREASKRPIQIETHILDFNEELYGEQVEVKFKKFLRPELKFNSVDELIENIKSDVAKARTFFWKKK
jgi:riboflavin kinase/FMN adenylyltransferase